MLSREQVIASLAEAMLANLIASEKAGYGLLFSRIAFGRRGGSIKAGRIVLEARVDGHLSNREAARAFDAFEQLYQQHARGEIPVERLERIKSEHDVEGKATRIRASVEPRSPSDQP